jgi:hypothetical protein
MELLELELRGLNIRFPAQTSTEHLPVLEEPPDETITRKTSIVLNDYVTEFSTNALPRFHGWQLMFLLL